MLALLKCLSVSSVPGCIYNRIQQTVMPKLDNIQQADTLCEQTPRHSCSQAKPLTINRFILHYHKDDLENSKPPKHFYFIWRPKIIDLFCLKLSNK